MNTEDILHDFAAFKLRNGCGDANHYELMEDIKKYLQSCNDEAADYEQSEAMS